jgi:membrane peptidoglycan carboxypeptidase
MVPRRGIVLRWEAEPVAEREQRFGWERGLDRRHDGPSTWAFLLLVQAVVWTARAVAWAAAAGGWTRARAEGRWAPAAGRAGARTVRAAQVRARAAAERASPAVAVLLVWMHRLGLAIAVGTVRAVDAGEAALAAMGRATWAATRAGTPVVLRGSRRASVAAARGGGLAARATAAGAVRGGAALAAVGRAPWAATRAGAPVALRGSRRASVAAVRGGGLAARATAAGAVRGGAALVAGIASQLEQGAQSRPHPAPARTRAGRRLRASARGRRGPLARSGALAPSWLAEVGMVLAALVLVVVVGAGTYLAGAQTSTDYFAQLPDVHALSQPLPADTVIAARDGGLLADVHDPAGVRHYDELLAAMGRWLPEATVAIEDESFWREPAVSPSAVARAAYLDWRDRGLRQGGSTITQQLVKLRLAGSARTYDRKLKEAVLAFQVEAAYSKRQILEMYLNAASYGNDAQGSLAAARNYFGVDTKDLDLAEAAMLAGIPQSPAYNSPLVDWPGARARQHQVLQAMVRAHDVTGPQADQAFAENLRPKLSQPAPQIRFAPAFTTWVLNQLVARFGEATAYGGGLRVTTTLDPNLQNLAQQAVVGNVNANRSRNMSQGAMVALDPTTGGVAAMVGSADPGANGGQYNMAVWPPRNPGSSFKIFTYTAAIASGTFTMATPIRDAPLTVSAPGSTPGWQPKNYDGRYHGTCPLAQCMGNSLNVPAVEVEVSMGVDKVAQLARRMGAPPYVSESDGSYHSDVPASTFGPSLTLGGYGETPLQMATGASTLGSGGVYHPPYGIAQVRDREGTALLTANPQAQAQQVLDPRVAYIMQTIMSDDDNRAMIFGRGSALTLPGRPVGAKTGTTDDFKDAWTLGYTPALASAFWFGNPNATPMATGWDAIYAAAPGWHAFMQAALDAMHQPGVWYGAPAGLQAASAGGKQVWLLPGTSANQPAPPLPGWASLGR